MKTNLRRVTRVATCGLNVVRIRPARVVVMLSLLLMLVIGLPAQVTTHPVDWVGGDVFAASGGGGYQVWHSANPTAANPSYAQYSNSPISDGLGGTTAGCGFDLAYRFFGTNSTNTQVDRYSTAFAHGIVEQVRNNTLFDPSAASPQSVALDSGKNLYIGYAGGVSGGLGTIEQWAKDTAANGTGKYTAFVASFPVTVDGTAGPGRIDLAADGHTIFYTAQTRKIYRFDSAQSIVSGSNPVVWADLSTLNGQNSVGTLYAIKILGPSYDGTNGVLVADQGNVKLIQASNGVITSFQVFKFKPLSNLQALTLDSFSPLTTFWVGDASATTNNLMRFNFSTTTTEAKISTGVGVRGVCLDGGFNGAQLAFQPSNTITNPRVQSFPLTPPTPANPTSDTFSFTSPFTGETLTATLPNLTNPVTVTIRDSLVDSSVALSDPIVFALNPGAPVSPIPTVPGNMPCDQTLTTLNGFSGTCEVLGFEANPNSVFSLPNIIIETHLSEHTPNLRVLSNHDEDGTDGVVDYPLSGRNCVLTVNQQTSNPSVAQLCQPTPLSPADGTVFTKSGGTATITFSLDVAAPGQCGSNNSTPTGLLPLLLIVQLQTSDPVTGITPAPVSVPVMIAGKSGGPPVMTLSGNTYQLQVKTTDIPSGFTYLATVIDLSGTIPSVSSHFTMQ